MRKLMTNKTLFSSTLVLALLTAGCEGPKGSQGPAGPAGPSGPPGIPANAPVITAVNPGIASPAMDIRIVGQNFSTTPEDNLVFFAGYPATVDAATATELTVRSPIAGDGITEVDVTVSVGGLTSNSVRFIAGSTGVDVGFPAAFAQSAEDVVRLGDGTIVYTDSSNAEIFKIAPNGSVSRFVTYQSLPYLDGPSRMTMTPSGNILVLDPNAAMVYEITPAGEAFVKLVNRSWDAAAYDGTTLYLLQTDGATIDQLLADGTLTEAWADLSAACAGTTNDIVAIAGRIYGGTSSGEICSIDVTAPGTVTLFTNAGDLPAFIDSLAVEGTGLVATGDFGSGDSFATAAIDVGTTTVTFTDEAAGNVPGTLESAVPAGGGTYVASTVSGSVFVTDGANWTMRATSQPAVLDVVELGANWYLSALSDAGSILEVPQDGTYRVAASDSALAGMFWFDLEPDGAMLLAVDIVGQKIVRINPTNGASTDVLDHSAVGTITGFARDAVGNFFVTSAFASADVAKYDAQGALQDPAFITGASNPYGIARIGTTLYIADVAGAVWQVAAATGGAVTAHVTAETTGTSIYGIAADRDGGIILAADDGFVYRVTPDHYIQPIAESGGIMVRATPMSDGRIVGGNLATTELHVFLP